MDNVYLSDLCSFLNIEFHFPHDVKIGTISTDTRTIQIGDAFLALIGETHDGHNYVQAAIEKGASVLIVSDQYTNECAIPVLRVPDTLKALGQIAACYRKRLNIKVVAVTGSSGKTTTKNMITQLLSVKYKVFSTYKNFNNQIGLPMTIFQLTQEHEIAVLEMGMNHFGEISELTKIACPDIAVITNIGSAHIGNLGSVENIMKAKLEIVEGMDPWDGVLILNGDNKYLRSREDIPYSKVLYAGTEATEQNYVYADLIKMQHDGVYFDLVQENVKTKCFIPIQGLYNINNAVLAITCALQLGVSMKDVKDTLSHFANEKLRNEEYRQNDIIIIKDYYNANPEAMRAALTTLKSYENGGRRIAILGEMKELGSFSSEEHRKLGELCRGLTDEVFFVGDSYRDFAEGYGASRHVFETKEKLADFLKIYIASGKLGEKDVILIKGSRSMKMEDVFEVIKDNLSLRNAN